MARLPLEDGADGVKFMTMSSALVDTISVYKTFTENVGDLTNPQWFGVPKFDSLVNAPESFKLFNLDSGEVAVEFGTLLDADGNPVNFETLMVKVEYLSLLNNKFSTDSLKLSFRNIDGELVEYSTEEIGNSAVEVLTTHQGKTSSIDYARKVYNREMSKLIPINSEEQIKSAVLSFPFIHDCIVTTNAGTIQILCKPKDPNDISESLDVVNYFFKTHGNIFATYKALYGNSLKFQFVIGGLRNTLNKDAIKAYLEDKFGYLNMGYQSLVDFSSLASEIYQLFGESLSFTIKLKEATLPTSYSILRGTTSALSGTDKTYLDSGSGLLFTKSSRLINTVSVEFAVGNNYVIDDQDYGIYLVDPLTNTGSFMEFQNSGRIVMSSNDNTFTMLSDNPLGRFILCCCLQQFGIPKTHCQYRVCSSHDDGNIHSS